MNSNHCYCFMLQYFPVDESTLVGVKFEVQPLGHRTQTQLLSNSGKENVDTSQVA